MAQAQDKQPDFAKLFAYPSIEDMLGRLDPYQFEDFVAYVFQQAGYVVHDTANTHGDGIDLELHSHFPPIRSTLLAGISVKRFQPPGMVTGPQVNGLRGGIAPLGMHGYVVTTSGLNEPAMKATAPEKTPRIWPIDGKHLVRYINYVRGTRHGVSAGAAGQASSNTASGGFAPLAPEAWLMADAIDRRAS